MLYTPLYDCCLFRNSYTNRAVNSGIQPKRSTSPPFFIFSEPAFIPGLNRFIKTVQSPARKAAAPTPCSFVYIFLFVSFFLCKRKKADSVESALLERKTRFELATLALARRCSTTEPLPHIKLGCLEPESNQRHEDFQSSALPTELSRLKKERRRRDSIPRPPA